MDTPIAHHDASVVSEPYGMPGMSSVERTGYVGAFRLQTRAFADATAGLLRQHLGLNQIYLLPLRLFIGVGWLRACAEKALDPEWRSGAELTSFLHEHMAQHAVAFPFYRILVTDVFLPHATLLSWVVMLGQLLAGIAILSGTLTNAALLGGLFMNVNFLLAGEPNPSAFYIVIQAVLLMTQAGFVLGGDARLSRTCRHPLLSAQCSSSPNQWLGRRMLAAGALLSLGVAGYGLVHIADFSPGGSIDDPAAIVTVMATLACMWFSIGYLRLLLLSPADDQTMPTSPAAADPSVHHPNRPAFRRLG